MHAWHFPCISVTVCLTLILSANSITVYMTDQYNGDGSWDQIARQFITAMGDARQDGRTGLIIAQQAKAEETAAEISRVFLGIQIQCAQCHDHPYDDWTREQFHQLAAFFPRTAMRPKLNSTTRTFEVVSVDRARFNGAGGGNRGRATLEHYTDLKQRGMLERTLVVWMGEFGRTPRINGRAGRDHYPRAFNVALAGGGVRGGQVIGKVSADGTQVEDRPVSVPDLFQSFCKSLEINADRENTSPIGRPIKIVDEGKPVDELFG